MTEIYGGIWVFAEKTGSRVAPVSLELLNKAKELASQAKKKMTISVVVLGNRTAEVVPELFAHGAEKVYLADDPRLKFYQHTTYEPVLEALVKKEKPEIFLFGATALGSELAPTLAARLRTGVAAHCVDLRLDEVGKLVAVVPAFGGKILGDILCPTAYPQMATVKPGIFAKAEADTANQSGEIEEIDLTMLDSVPSGLKALGIIREKPQGLPLEEAEIVVCGGYGIGSQENWDILQEIAQLLGGALACTRPAVDEGWAPGEYMMVGTSGKTIRPKIYLGFGVSGATHHICGMKDALLIININKDEDAPIFEVSDLGITADLQKILPILLNKLRETNL